MTGSSKAIVACSIAALCAILLVEVAASPNPQHREGVEIMQPEYVEALAKELEKESNRRFIKRTLDQIGGGNLLKRSRERSDPRFAIIAYRQPEESTPKIPLEILRVHHPDDIPDFSYEPLQPGQEVPRVSAEIKSIDNNIRAGLMRGNLDQIGGGNLVRRRSLDTPKDLEAYLTENGKLDFTDFPSASDIDTSPVEYVTLSVAALKTQEENKDPARNDYDVVGFGHSKKFPGHRKPETLDSTRRFSETILYPAELIELSNSKRNLDEIDRSGFSGFNKRNFDEIDRSGFGFNKRNFDEIDRSGFGFNKRNFDEIDRSGFGFNKRNFDEIDRSGFGFNKRNFDEIDRSGFGFNKRNFDEIDRSGFSGFNKRNFDEIDRTSFSGFNKRNFDEIDRSGIPGFAKRRPARSAKIAAQRRR